MAGEELRNAAAASLSEPDGSTLSQDVSRFLQSLTDRQLQVMQDGMRQMFTRDEISEMVVDVVKIMTTISRKIIVPQLGEVLNLDSQTLFPRPGSSRQSLLAINKDVVKAMLKTIGGFLEEKEDSHMLQLLSNVMDKVELLPPTHGSVELRHSSLPVEQRIKKPKELTSEDQAQLQECAKDMILEICSISESKELERKSETELSYPPKMSITIREFVDCLLSELVDMTKSSRSSLISDDIGSDPARNVHRIPSLMKLSRMAFKMENQTKASIPAQTLRNASSYARIFVDELLLQLESITKSEDSDDDQAKCRQGSPDLSRTAELLVDHIMAYIQEVSASPFGDDIPAVPLDFPCVIQWFGRDTI
ncbi:uncharacterized protein LOC118821058 [Colossoma macropomum]|uniref:uncharacterized protein LOC118821058 n=1 Tax=Colossoma macropomum TaxID=42526 RepID=UPI001864A705|nr:uncharacterized protein LOC118821058 [Colossoma macropomum]